MPSSKRQFPCSVCEKNFLSEEKLRRHSLKHANNRPYACHVCVATFRHSSNLKRHLNEVHASEKKFSCPLCGRKFRALDYANRHMKSHSQDELHQYASRKNVSIPGKENHTLSQRKKSDVDKHNRSSLNVGKIEQSSKRKKLIERNGRVEELPENEGKSNIVLNGKSSERDEDSGNGSSDTTEDERRNSYIDAKNFSSLPRPCVCHICKKCFTVNSSLNRHIRKVHAKDKNSSCQMPGEKFQAQESVHLNVKSPSVNDQQRAPESVDGNDSSSSESKLKKRKKDPEKFVCTKCDRNFNKQDSLEKHAKSHLPPELFTCDKCKESFASKTRLAAHIASHSDWDEPPQCSTRNGVGVIRYQRVRKPFDHQGSEFCSDIVAEFECNLCGIVYDKEVKLRQHVKEKHVRMVLKEKYLCTLCEPAKTFEKEYNFRAHFEFVHEKGEGSGYTCLHCSENFSYKVNLQFHIERCQINNVD